MKSNTYMSLWIFYVLLCYIYTHFTHQGTGDIVVDMESQVKANSTRIMVLEEQNGALRNSVAKVLQTQQRGPKEVNNRSFQ